MSVIVIPQHSKEDLEIILGVLPEPNFVEISAYPDPKTSATVKTLLEEIEDFYKPHLLMDDRSCHIEVSAMLKNPSKQAILDFYESGHASFKEAIWHDYNPVTISTLTLTPVSFELFYLNSTPIYFPDLRLKLEKTRIKLDVKTEINGLKIVRS